MLSSSGMFKNIVDFNVLDFCDLFSDVHCPLEIKLVSSASYCEVQTESINKSYHKLKLWDHEKANSFCENIDLTKVAEITF